VGHGGISVRLIGDIRTKRRFPRTVLEFNVDAATLGQMLANNKSRLVSLDVVLRQESAASRRGVGRQQGRAERRVVVESERRRHHARPDAHGRPRQATLRTYMIVAALRLC
jgi:hypothetical protein